MRGFTPPAPRASTPSVGFADTSPEGEDLSVLTLLKEIPPQAGHAAAMYQTYELYLREGVSSQPRFEPLTAKSAVQAIQRARALLETDAGIASVEVRLAGEHLFTLER